MRLLLKLIVLGFIGLAILPAFAPEQYRQASGDAADDPETPSAFQFMAVISQAATDLGNICTRQPGMCESGSALIGHAASRAREGLEIAYAMFRHGHPSMQDKAEETDEVEAAAE